MLNRLKTKLYDIVFGKLELIETETLPNDVQITVGHLDGTQDVIWTKEKRNIYKRKRHSELEFGGIYVQLDDPPAEGAVCHFQFETEYE